MPAAARTDIVILDWHLGDDGEHALSILAKLAERPGLRLVAVYTYDDALDEVAQRVKERLGGVTTDPFRVVASDLVIEIYAKSGSQLDGSATARIKDEASLAPQLISDFGRMTAGIVPSATVAVIGAIRASTPRVLALLSSDLDLGFLGNRILLPDPDDSADQLLDLVGAELRTVVEDDDLVAQATGFDVVRAYVTENQPHELPASIVIRALEHGTVKHGFMEEVSKTDAYQSMNRPKLGNEKTSMTRLFTGDVDSAYAADSLFGRAMSLRTDSARMPRLTLGTVVRHDDEWWVCVQPVCHSVRIDEPRAFPLLPAKKVGRDAKQDLLLHVDGADQALAISLDLYRARLVEFAPDTLLRAVAATANGDRIVFESVGEGEFEYVAQLRRDHAQRLETDFAHGVGRVGLDESEVLRRWREKR